MSGNQTATVVVSGRRLAEYLGLNFATPIWWHLGTQGALDEDRIRTMVKQGEGLAPGPDRMGDELLTVADHEARIAWLAQRDVHDWTPLEISTDWHEEGDRVPIMVSDGHHRLLSTLIRDRRIAIEVTSGNREALEGLLMRLDGSWQFRPKDRLFGRGVFPASALGEEAYIEVSCASGKVWINELSHGVSVARYGAMVWSVEPFPVASMSERVAETASGRKEEVHRARFLDTCETRLGVDKYSLARYCQEAMSQ